LRLKRDFQKQGSRQSEYPAFEEGDRLVDDGLAEVAHPRIDQLCVYKLRHAQPPKALSGSSYRAAAAGTIAISS
jgi:hypothetical protein